MLHSRLHEDNESLAIDKIIVTSNMNNYTFFANRHKQKKTATVYFKIAVKVYWLLLLITVV